MAQTDELPDDRPLTYHLHAVAAKLTPQPIQDLIALVLVAYQNVLLAMQQVLYWRIRMWDFILGLDFRRLVEQLLRKVMSPITGTSSPSPTKEKDVHTNDQREFFMDTSRTICRLLVQGNLDKLRDYSSLAPDLGFNSETTFGWTPLHAAVCTGDPKLVSFILSQKMVDVNAAITVDFDENQPSLAIIESELCKAPPKGLATGATKGASPLHLACMFGNAEIIKLLLDNGASFVAQDAQRRRPIQYFQLSPSSEATLRMYHELYNIWCKKLLSLDLDSDAERIQQVIDEGDFQTFEMLLEARPIAVTERTPQGWTLLHVAVIRKLRPFITAILKHTAGNKAFINEIDTWSDPDQRRMFAGDEYPHRYVTSGTALHYACLTGDFEIIGELLRAGADWTRVDAHGRDPKAMFTLYPDGRDKSRFQDLCDEQATREDEQRTGSVQPEVCVPVGSVSDSEEASAPGEGWGSPPTDVNDTKPLEKVIGEKIIGQRGPIRSVCSAIRLRENGWVDPERPLVMLFLGSSGVGKTELAKQIALYSHNKTFPSPDTSRSIIEVEKENGFIRIDMTEYQQSHTAANLFGSPKGYVGYEEGGALSSKLQANPRAVVLLDEVEKAHPDVLTVFLQVFGDGRLTDAKIGTVYCQDAVFIMTSNLASKEIKEHAPFLRKLIETVDDRPEEYNRFIGSFNRRIYPVLKKSFKRDEFLGRINQTIVFLPLNESEIHNVISNELSTWKSRASEKHGITIDWAREVIQKLARSYDVNYGVRSVLNEVNKIAVQIVAEAHIRGDLKDGWLVYLTLNQVGDIVMRSMDPKSGLPQRRGCRFLLG